MPSDAPLTLAQLQDFAAAHKAAADRAQEDENTIVDMLQRIAAPPVNRVQADEATIQDMVNRLAGPPMERVREDTKRLARIQSKLALPAYERVQEDESVLTGMLARVQHTGFPARDVRLAARPTNPNPAPVVPPGAYPPGRPAAAYGIVGALADIGASQTTRPFRTRPVLGGAPAAGVPDIGDASRGLPKLSLNTAPTAPPSAALAPAPLSGVSGGCVDGSDPVLPAVAQSLANAGLPAGPYAAQTALSYARAVGCAVYSTSMEFNQHFADWLGANSPLACPYSVSADLTAPANALSYDPCVGAWTLQDSTTYDAPVTFVACQPCAGPKPPPSSPPPPSPPPPPPPPSQPPPAPPTPPAPGCDLCEAITYLGQVIQHCCAQQQPAQLERDEPLFEPIPPPDAWPDFEDTGGDVGPPAPYAPAPPPALRPFGSEAGGAVGGETTALDVSIFTD